MIIIPPYLKIGDKIAIAAPAGKIAPENVSEAKKILESWGLKVVLGKNLFNDHFQYSAPDADRLFDLQAFLDDNSVKAILLARGGYGTIRILDQIDFSGFRKSPKWLIGFSDVTIFHSHIHQNLKIETIHASMTAGLKNQLSELSLRKALSGESSNYEIETHSLSRKGNAKGILVGGNLAILCSLIGTASDIETKRKILFIEDVGEYLYRLDRMMWQMKRAGKLNNLAGLVVGGFTEMKDNDATFGKTANEIVSEAVHEFGYPVCFGFPAGHQEDNRALIIGRKTEIIIGTTSILRQG